MTNILTDIATPEVVAAVVNYQIAYRTVLGHAPIAEWHDEAGLTRYSSGIDSWVGNLVIRTQLRPDEVEAKVREVLEYSKGQGRHISWAITPLTQPVDLGKYLEAYGMRGFSGIPNMVVDLNTLAELNLPAGLTIKRVENTADVPRWVDTFISAYELGAAEGELFASALSNMSPEQQEIVNLYWAWQGGLPVATAVAVLAEGVVSIYGVATMPAARRQGIGAAITAAPLLEARAKGYRIAGLQAARESYELYRRLGFRDLFYTGAYWLPDNNDEL
jgi:ribosomal protein S18 acetylase RimI-like enzyme